MPLIDFVDQPIDSGLGIGHCPVLSHIQNVPSDALNNFPCLAAPREDMHIEQPAPQQALTPGVPTMEEHMQTPFAFQSEHLFVHNYLIDNAVACIPSEPAQQPSTAPAESTARDAPLTSHLETSIVASESKATPAKAISIIRPSNEKDLDVRPALVRTEAGVVLSANVDQQSKIAFWDWQRASAAIGFKTEKPGKYLRDNRDMHRQALMEAEVSINQIHYEGWESTARGQHSLQSQAFV